MSREWYIHTDRRHVQDTFGDIDTTPLSPREKWRKNRKKYLRRALVALIAAAAVLLALPGIFHRTAYDYTVTLVTASPADSKTCDALAAALAAIGEDTDKNGTVTVKVRNIAVGEAQKNATDRQEQLLTSFFSEEYTLFAMESDCYERYIAAYTAENAQLFSPLDAAADTLTTDGTLFADGTWLFGVRALPHAGKQAAAAQAAHLRLLQRYIAAKAK